MDKRSNRFYMICIRPKKYNEMDTTIDDVLTTHSKEGYLMAVSDGSVKHMHQMSFGWLLLTANRLYLGEIIWCMQWTRKIITN